MPDREKIITTGLAEFKGDMEALSAPPGFKTIGRFEATFAQSFAYSQETVHVITGYLKSTGTPFTHYDGKVWEGEIEYDAHPGIFELARHQHPTANHPEGEHENYLDMTQFYGEYEKCMDGWFQDALGRPGS